jgi:hypothetical protein
VAINYLSVDRNGVQYKDCIRLKLLFHENKHQYMNECKLTPQDSRSYRKRKTIDKKKKPCVCIVAEKITKLEIVL